MDPTSLFNIPLLTSFYTDVILWGFLIHLPSRLPPNCLASLPIISPRPIKHETE